MQTTHTARPIRVLLAEDDHDLRVGLARLLELDGFVVRTVNSGTSLLEALGSAVLSGRADQFVDVIVSDVRMPGVSGLVVAEGLRAAGWGLPIVLITAYSDEALRDRVSRIDGVECLAKPCDPELLEALLDQAASRGGSTH